MMNQSLLQLSSFAPVRKNAPVGARERLRTVRDTQDLTQENISDNRLELFPPNPTRDNVARNYEQNPFPRNLPVRFLAYGFGINKPYIEEASGVTPELFMNQLKRTAVEVRRQEGDKRVIRHHMSQLVDWEKVGIEYAAADDGTNEVSLTAVNFRTKLFHRLPDPDKVSLKPDERFELTIRFDAESNIPAEADLTVGLIGFIQVAHPPYRS